MTLKFLIVSKQGADVLPTSKVSGIDGEDSGHSAGGHNHDASSIM